MGLRSLGTLLLLPTETSPGSNPTAGPGERHTGMDGAGEPCRDREGPLSGLRMAPAADQGAAFPSWRTLPPGLARPGWRAPKLAPTPHLPLGTTSDALVTCTCPPKCPTAHAASVFKSSQSLAVSSRCCFGTFPSAVGGRSRLLFHAAPARHPAPRTCVPSRRPPSALRCLLASGGGWGPLVLWPDGESGSSARPREGLHRAGAGSPPPPPRAALLSGLPFRQVGLSHLPWAPRGLTTAVGRFCPHRPCRDSPRRVSASAFARSSVVLTLGFYREGGSGP